MTTRDDYSYYGHSTNKLFFLDRFYIERLRGLEFRFHPAVKYADNPFLTPQHPWEGWRSFPYGRSVMVDPATKRFRMWYETQHDGLFTGAWERSSIKRTAYAESADGLHWQRPNLGQVLRDGSTDNSLIDMGPFGIHFANVIDDQHDPDPTQRYKMMFWGMPPEHSRAEAPMAVNVAGSADGLTWRLLRSPSDPPFSSRQQVAPKTPLAGDTIGLYGWDDFRQRYVAFLKSPSLVPRGYRTICYTESEDFINWSRLVSVLAPDEYDVPGTEFYYMQVFRYADLYVGLLCVYHNYDRRSYAWADPTLECPPEVSHLNQRLDVRLAFSRDLQVWQQAGRRQPFVNLGQFGVWDGGMIFPSTMLDVGDETWVYYGGSPMRHVKDDLQHAGEVIDGQRYGIFGGLAKLRRDGFVSLSAGETPGEFTTRALYPSGAAFRVNARTVEDGEVVVRLLDETGQTLADAPPARFKGDAVDAVLDLPVDVVARLAGQRIRIHVTARHADLYTLTI